jgi:hypothetical protein
VHLTEKRVQLSQHLWAALARMAQPGETEDATLARLLRSHPEMRNVLADADPPEGGVADPQ